MWDSEMVLLLRYVIDDIDEPTKYSDDKLQQLLLAAGQFVKAEVILEQEYVINIENYSLKPDPTSKSYRDDSFINLTVLKAACLLSSAPLSKLPGRSLRIRENQYEFDGRFGVDASKLAVETACQAYKDAKWEFMTGHSVAGEVIIGPYRALIPRGGPWR